MNTKCSHIFLRREPIYRALTSMPPLSHWPDRSNKPFDAANSLVLAFIRGAAHSLGIELEKGEDLAIFKAVTASRHLIIFNKDTCLWSGSGSTAMLNKTYLIASRIARKAAFLARHRHIEPCEACGKPLFAELGEQCECPRFMIWDFEGRTMGLVKSVLVGAKTAQKADAKTDIVPQKNEQFSANSGFRFRFAKRNQ